MTKEERKKLREITNRMHDNWPHNDPLDDVMEQDDEFRSAFTEILKMIEIAGKKSAYRKKAPHA